MSEVSRAVWSALRRVDDPDLKKDLVSLGMIEELTVQDHTIVFTIVLTTSACPLQEMLKQSCKKAIHDAIGGDYAITIHTRAEVTSAPKATNILTHVKNIVAIASGKGGVGKSTMATHLALSLSKYGATVGLLDGDLFDPSIPTMWGCEQSKPEIMELEGVKKMVPIKKYGIQLISMGFLLHDQESVVWRGPMASAGFKQLLHETHWDALDYLLIDLPPGTSDIHLTLAKMGILTGVVVVTTPQKIACIGARKAIDMLQKPTLHVPILGLIENMAYLTQLPNMAHHPYYLFGEDGGRMLAQEKDIPFLGKIPIVPEICTMGDVGVGVDAPVADFNQVTQNLAQQISIVNVQKSANDARMVSE